MGLMGMFVVCCKGVLLLGCFGEALVVGGGRKRVSFARHSLPKVAASLGAPRGLPGNGTYATSGGVGVTRRVEELGLSEGLQQVEELIDRLDVSRGTLLASSYEVPGRYARWTLGFCDPPVVFSGRSRDFEVRALNRRGQVILGMFLVALRDCEAVESLEPVFVSDDEGDRLEATTTTGSSPPSLAVIRGKVKDSSKVVPSCEEERSKQASLLSVVRACVRFMYHPSENQLGLYGAFGYDLMFQFEPMVAPTQERTAQRDVVLYLPDDVLVVDQRENTAWRTRFDFSFCEPGAFEVVDTAIVPRDEEDLFFSKAGDKLSTVDVEQQETTPSTSSSSKEFQPRDMAPGDFSKLVDVAKEEFKCGNLFEVVLSQQWREACEGARPSALFRELRTRNPSPYGFLMNLGGEEFLVGASPEMYVRVERVDSRLRVETCPISGTIARGADALEDASQVRRLLASAKDESELTMCTDVDRNDKSRVCDPGTVNVIGRRQIEMYSRLIHTVDHVEGYLRSHFDALDAFLCHAWAVTVTGAPKTWAARFVEKHERSQRAWYGGAVGHVGFDGSLNTGLTLRTIHVKHDLACVRAGATLLYDSDPAAEEAETELKASAMRDAIEAAKRASVLRAQGGDQATTEDQPQANKKKDNARTSSGVVSSARLKPNPTVAGIGKRVLLIDHEDSFVHTLANYLRQTGADVRVVRFGDVARRCLGEEEKWDLVVLSPGPGRPQDFAISETLDLCLAKKIPIFGVCLGLQGIIEHFGGTLGTLGAPVHGKPATVDQAGDTKWAIFRHLPDSFDVARYHSLHADDVPSDILVTAKTNDDGVVMAIEHKTLPLAAVQFHPESILTNPRNGLQILANCLTNLRYHGSDDSGDHDYNNDRASASSSSIDETRAPAQRSTDDFNVLEKDARLPSAISP